MHFFAFLAAFLLLQRIRKALKLTPLDEKWGKQLNYACWGIMIFGIGVINGIHNDGLEAILGAGTLLGVLYFIYSEEDFAPWRFYISAHYPLAGITLVVGIVQLIAKSFYASWQTYFAFATLAAFVWVFARWANSKKQQEQIKVVAQKNTELDRLVAERTAELTMQKNALQETVKLLQATQAQLIQQEKLASLGELTAGIAHEIQNPLNFVNNFSEVSIELIDEMEEEMGKGDLEEATAIANDIRQNLEKIMHHGKRADGIVKGMLQHSRASSNTKEPININNLADEYLRLAYHGLRAKDKLFNAELVTHYDPNLPPVNVVPQDLGRVLLNLLTNAFYAVQQRQKMHVADYAPTVTVTTALYAKSVKVTVRDNGMGIPESIREKIMQPFFTTKPTGEGTGLGLSLSYDIVVKGHGGKIDLNTKEGEFTEFVITLPL